VSEESLARARGKVRESTIDVEPENAGAVRLFIALGTQWRYQPRSNGKIEILVRTGLDYSVVPLVAQSLRVDTDEPLLAQLRILEAETLTIDAKRNVRAFAGHH